MNSEIFEKRAWQWHASKPSEKIIYSSLSWLSIEFIGDYLSKYIFTSIYEYEAIKFYPDLLGFLCGKNSTEPNSQNISIELHQFCCSFCNRIFQWFSYHRTCTSDLLERKIAKNKLSRTPGVIRTGRIANSETIQQKY